MHSMKDVPRTISSLASYVIQLVKSAASQDRTRTDLIMDQYPDVSTKKPQRENGVVQAVAFKYLSITAIRSVPPSGRNT